MQKVKFYFIILLLTFPFLISFNPLASNDGYVATYKSPEGIQFVSFSVSWDKNNLINLYKELIKNKHGNEIKQLQQVKIYGEQLSASPTKGSYHALSKTITLYQGDKYKKPVDYRETLSHEYGHHFGYHYFPEHHFPFSTWQLKRGIDVTTLRWDAFWNYSDNDHAFYPQEVFADDYVLLYGTTNKMDSKSVTNNEAFYKRTIHENQQLPNVLESQELLHYIEEQSGLSIDKNRLIQSPKLVDWNKSTLTYLIEKKANVAYRLNLQSRSNRTNKTHEIHLISTDQQDKLEFSLNQLELKTLANSDFVTVNIDVVDLTTSLGFKTKEQMVRING